MYLVPGGAEIVMLLGHVFYTCHWIIFPFQICPCATDQCCWGTWLGWIVPRTTCHLPHHSSLVSCPDHSLVPDDNEAPQPRDETWVSWHWSADCCAGHSSSSWNICDGSVEKYLFINCQDMTWLRLPVSLCSKFSSFCCSQSVFSAASLKLFSVNTSLSVCASS